METVRSLSGLPLVLRAPLEPVIDSDPLDDQDLVLELDVPLRLRRQPSLRSIDTTRLQRATQGAGESTGRGRDDVVEGGGVLRILAGGGAVVLPDRAMGAEQHRFLLDGQVRHSDRSLLANDPDPRYVCRLVHSSPPS